LNHQLEGTDAGGESAVLITKQFSSKNHALFRGHFVRGNNMGKSQHSSGPGGLISTSAGIEASRQAISELR
jgi:multimeric flavodoxin WrbA